MITAALRLGSFTHCRDFGEDVSARGFLGFMLQRSWCVGLIVAKLSPLEVRVLG